MSAINHEMVTMARVFSEKTVRVLILTARPEFYKRDTQLLLMRANVRHDALIMLPGDAVPQSSAAWKQEQVANIMKTHNVLFMVEDYRGNAEAIRALVPVLLYERQKQSVHFTATYTCCGGMAACFCPPRD